MNSKASYQAYRHPLEVVILNELVQVDAEQLKRDAQMSSEHEVILHSNDVVVIIRVIVSQMC